MGSLQGTNFIRNNKNERKLWEKSYSVDLLGFLANVTSVDPLTSSIVHSTWSPKSKSKASTIFLGTIVLDETFLVSALPIFVVNFIFIPRTIVSMLFNFISYTIYNFTLYLIDKTIVNYIYSFSYKISYSFIYRLRGGNYDT